MLYTCIISSRLLCSVAYISIFGLRDPCIHVCSLPALGWNFIRYKKGVYIDGHEREDVVTYRKNFLEKMQELEQFMVQYDDKTLEPLPNHNIESGKFKRHILVTQDESIFHANDGKRFGWVHNGEQPLMKKGLGKGIMVSMFLVDTIGILALPENDLAISSSFPREAYEIFEYGGNNGYWTSEHMIKQVNYFLKIYNLFYIYYLFYYRLKKRLFLFLKNYILTRLQFSPLTIVEIIWFLLMMHFVHKK